MKPVIRRGVDGAVEEKGARRGAERRGTNITQHKNMADCEPERGDTAEVKQEDI